MGIETIFELLGVLVGGYLVYKYIYPTWFKAIDETREKYGKKPLYPEYYKKEQSDDEKGIKGV